MSYLIIERQYFLKIAIAMLPAFFSLQSGSTQDISPRSELLFNFNWQFKKGKERLGFNPHLDDRNWEDVQLPHDAGIYGPFTKRESNAANGWRPHSAGWYRKTFFLPENAEGKQVIIAFDGVYRAAEVWINGRYLGKQLNGYLGFEYDITAYTNRDRSNVIAVHYDNTVKGTSRWYTGEGIYRDVWLKLRDPLHVETNGVYITTPKVSSAAATVSIQTEVTNEHEQAIFAELITEIYNPAGKIVGETRSIVPIPSNSSYLFDQELSILNPALWSPDTPELYRAITKLNGTGILKDQVATNFGVREILFTPDRGLLLNGQKVFAKGGNLHHDLGCLGAAALERGYEQRLSSLKEMGCNALRLSHNPHAPVLLDLCDRMGFLVIDEAYDKWTSQYYGGEVPFSEVWKTDLAKFIKRDRNHPSVFLWSVGNEVLKQQGLWDDQFETPADGSTYGVSLLKEMVNFTHRLDPSRKVTCALFPLRENGMKEWEMQDAPETYLESLPPPMAFHMDVVSWNYTENMFRDDHVNYPQMMFIASETGTNLGYDYRKLSWLEIDTSYTIGHFFWSAYAYLGESPFPRKGWECAFFNLNEEKTPTGWLYQSFYDQEPFVRLFMHEQDSAKLAAWEEQYPNKRWSWPPMSEKWENDKSTLVKVTTFSNCDEIELFVNGIPQGTQKVDELSDRILEWTVLFQAGTIKAVGKKSGRIVAEHTIKTPESPQQLQLQPDRSEIRSDGLDLSYISVSITDADGITVPDADRKITFEITGPGIIAGVANADISSDEPFQAAERSTFEGKCLLVVRSKRSSGQITINAFAQGLEVATCKLMVK